MNNSRIPLLTNSDPPVFTIHQPEGRSPFLLTGDHAGRAIPQALGTLGVSAADMDRHIAWDIGIAGVGRELARLLDAFFIAQNYSRLVIDCNRPLQAPDLIAILSEETVIHGNIGLSEADAMQRIDEIFQPYHQRLRVELDCRAEERRPTILITLHSFTPVYAGTSRPWHIGVLYQRDNRLGLALLKLLQAEEELVVGDNEPYSVNDESDYAIPVYGERRGLLHVEIEIRQDLISDLVGQRIWAERLARLLPLAEAAV